LAGFCSVEIGGRLTTGAGVEKAEEGALGAGAALGRRTVGLGAEDG